MSSSEDCLCSVRSSGRRRIPSHAVDVPRPSSLGRDRSRSRSTSTHENRVGQVNMVDHSSEHSCLACSTPPSASTQNDGDAAPWSLILKAIADFRSNLHMLKQERQPGRANTVLRSDSAASCSRVATTAEIHHPLASVGLVPGSSLANGWVFWLQIL